MSSHLRRFVSRKPSVTSSRSPRTRLWVNTLEDRVTPANFEVSTLASDSSAGSLRAAIESANAAPGSDTITFSALFNSAQTIPVGGAELLITDDLTITGPGAAGSAPILTIDGGGTSRVLNISGATGVTLNVALSGLIVTGGLVAAGNDGAGIFALDESLTLDRVVVRGNAIQGTGTFDSGAGIAFSNAVGSLAEGGGSLTVRNSTISGNSSPGRGAGIYFFNSGSLVMEASTVSGNTVRTTTIGGGGALYFYWTPGPAGLTIANSTIAGNTAVFGNGGGIQLYNLDGTFNLLNSTVTGNTSGSTGADPDYGYGGGGISNLYQATGVVATLNIQSSIVSGNTANVINGHNDIAVYNTTVVNVDHSAIGAGSGFDYTDPTGTNLPLGANLGLGLLQDNGGPTFTIAIPSNSPAVGAGSNPSVPPLTTDQRGHARVQGSGIDIGAFEVDTGVPTAGGTFTNLITGDPTYAFQVTYSDPSSPIALASLGNDDIRVTGPNGFSQLAALGTVNSTNPNIVIANYTITAPGGSWDPAENGVYSIAVEPNSVTNGSGTPIPAGALGTFQILIGTTFHVTSIADTGAGSLREAITQANSNFAGTADTIVFDGPTFGTNPATITLASALPTVTEPLTISGTGSSLLTVTRDAAAATSFRIFTVAAATAFSATISGMTITGGMTSGTVLATRVGGAVRVGSLQNLTVADSVITGNSASGEGGAFYVGTIGTLTIRNSTVSGNTSGTDAAAPYRSGGGIYMRSGGFLLVENSTISGNTSPTLGGGIYMFGGGFPQVNWIIRNSTITGNTASTGGGIAAYVTDGTNPLTIESSTIVGNTATTEGGGIASTISGTATPAVLNITNSVVAFNSAPNAPDLLGVASTGRSLVHNQSGSTITDDGTSLAAGTDPLFVGGTTPTLANNGGPTQTIALQSGSPLINAGTATVPGISFDQRGSPFVRVSGSATDIGAFEVQSAVVPTVASAVVNGSAAAQRSRVTSLVVTFSTVVTFAGSPSAAFALIRTGGGAVTFTATVTTVGGATVVTLNGFTGTEAESGSLRDGRYTLTVLANQVSAGGTPMASNFTFGDAQGLFRYYGDMTGDRRVDIADFGFFSLAYLTPANYNPALDFNNDARIDIADFGQFSVRYFTTLP